MSPINDQSATHSLAAVAGVPAAIRDLLRKNWIETAEQVVSIAATREGRDGLAALLEMDDDGMTVFLETLKTILGEEAYGRLNAAAPGGPCGASLTEEQKRRFGV